MELIVWALVLIVVVVVVVIVVAVIVLVVIIYWNVSSVCLHFSGAVGCCNFTTIIAMVKDASEMVRW